MTEKTEANNAGKPLHEDCQDSPTTGSTHFGATVVQFISFIVFLIRKRNKLAY